MKKKLALFLAAVAVISVAYQPSAEAVNLGNVINRPSIGRGTTNRSVLNQAANKAVNKMQSKTITFQSLPQTAADVAVGNDAYRVAAMAVAALARYETSPDDSIAMLNVLLGPRPVNGIDSQFIRDRYRGKAYIMRSYFKGATPKNNYTPNQPYAVEIQTNPYTYQQKGYARFLVASGGTDTPRPITVRQKESTGEWFLWDYKSLLTGIRIPASEDPWS